MTYTCNKSYIVSIKTYDHSQLMHSTTFHLIPYFIEYLVYNGNDNYCI